MTRVELHDLRWRRDRDGWLVGRMDTGAVVAVPEVGMRAVLLLRDGLSVEETRARLLEECSVRLDVAGFVAGLARAGLLTVAGAAPAGQQRPPPRPTFAWLRPRHVRWASSPALPALALLAALSAAVLVAARPGLLPHWRDLLWSPHGTLVLLGQAAAGWTLVLAHELAHLVTARAAGVPGRITLGTRLQFLAAQTDVSGIWLAERRERLTVYLAGMATDLTAAALCLLASSVTGRQAVLSLVVLTALTMVAAQFLVFMRTDVYFVLQDLTGCRDLYGEAVAYLRHLVVRRGPDPSLRLPPRERVSVRAYTLVLVAGTAGCLAVAGATTVPALLAVLGGAVRGVAGARGAPGVLDGLAVLAVVGGTQALWARAWWRRHGPRVRRQGRALTAHRLRPADRGRRRRARLRPPRP